LPIPLKALLRKKLILFFALILFVCYTHAQYTLRVVVTGIAAKPNDDIYIAGNFNNWNPADNNSKLKPFAGGRRIIVFNNIMPNRPS